MANRFSDRRTRLCQSTPLGVQLLEPRILLAADILLDRRIVVHEAPTLVQFSVELTDVEGRPLEAIAANEEFQARVFAEDLRNIIDYTAGVVSASLTLDFPEMIAEIAGDVSFGPDYRFITDVDEVRDGRAIDLQGAANFLDHIDGPSVGSGPKLFAIVPFRAKEIGSSLTSYFYLGKSNRTNAEVNLYDPNGGTFQPLLAESAGQIDYGSDRITIVPVGAPLPPVPAEDSTRAAIPASETPPAEVQPEETHHIAEAPVEISLRVTGLDGKAIERIEPGGDFQVQIFLEDQREVEVSVAGVISAYMSFLYDHELVKPVGDVQFAAEYSFLTGIGSQGEGIIADINGSANFIEFLRGGSVGYDSKLFATIPFQLRDGVTSGAVRFETLPSHAVGAEINLFGNRSLTWQPDLDANAGEVNYGTISLPIGATPVVEIPNDPLPRPKVPELPAAPPRLPQNRPQRPMPSGPRDIVVKFPVHKGDRIVGYLSSSAFTRIPFSADGSVSRGYPLPVDVLAIEFESFLRTAESLRFAEDSRPRSIDVLPELESRGLASGYEIDAVIATYALPADPNESNSRELDSKPSRPLDTESLDHLLETIDI